MELASMQPGLSPGTVYPPPPRVRWLVLFLSWFVLSGLIQQYAPSAYQELLESLVVDGWAFYVCLWIRRVDPDCKSAFWCDVYVVVELVYASLTIRQNPSPRLHTVILLLGLVSGVLGIVTIDLVRSDLLRHYNEREPIGLQLGIVKTFFFTFFYFQYHLHEIAELKWRQAGDRLHNPGRTLLP